MPLPDAHPDAPLYNEVKQDLGIDPVEVGGRPKWSFEEADRRLNGAPSTGKRRA